MYQHFPNHLQKGLGDRENEQSNDQKQMQAYTMELRIIIPLIQVQHLLRAITVRFQSEPVIVCRFVVLHVLHVFRRKSTTALAVILLKTCPLTLALINAVYSSFNLLIQFSLSLGPDRVRRSGIAASVFFVASSTMLTHVGVFAVQDTPT